MTGIFLLAVVGFWLWACVAVARALMRKRNEQPWRLLLGPVVFVVMLVAPVADEIVGGFQFRALCEKQAVVELGVGNPIGRVTRYSGEPIDRLVPGTAIPILWSHVEYHDVATGELVAKTNRYVAKGGLLIRALGIFSSPLTIGSPACSGERGVSLPSQLKFEVVN